jgi:hypothetical protein
MTALWAARDPDRVAVGRWLGRPLTPDEAETVLGIVHFGNLLVRDCAAPANEPWQLYVEVARVVERVNPEDPLVTWTIASFLDRFPRGRDRADGGALWYDTPERAVLYGRMGFLHRLDPELYALAERRVLARG